MGKVSVDDIVLTPLRRVPVAGGDVLHAIKRSDPGFSDFGEAYFSMIELGFVKAWKRHTRMTLNLVVPIGRVRFVFVDDEHRFRELETGEDHYCRMTVPPGLWFGFQGLAAPLSLLLNVADIEHDPSEVERKDRDDIRFDWGSRT
ncbi:MAG: dTDP-4-dehydrorhamnose 3,5-epimerase [Betaproteobacteria bacterium]|nr:dTDP-4-dehydrorhamnose 3,5-epimerase [Betaproteobacteria bacterium]